MRYIIIGNGAAGTQAALTIREKDVQSEVTLLSSDHNLFYYRPRIIDYLADKVILEKFTAYKEAFYQEKDITIKLNTGIVRIDPDTKNIYDTAGSNYTYDKLLLATGAEPFIPDIPGTKHQGVFSLRSVSDADSIKTYCGSIDKVVIIGGGLLGLETAYSLTLLGKQATVIEFCDRLLPRQLDHKGAKLLQKMIEEKGINFILNDSITEIKSENDRVASIVLASGKEITTQSVIFSMGIRSNLDLANQAGLTTDKGIIVNEFLQTSHPDIYAAGDVAEWNNIVYGLWAPALEQGKYAGLNMTGAPASYKGTDMSTMLKITGIDLYSSGDIHGDECQNCTSNDETSYKKLVLKGNKAVGAIVLGDKKALQIARKVMGGTLDPDEFKNLL